MTVRRWKQDAWHSGRIVDEQGRTVGNMATPDLAAETIKTRQDRAELLAALEAAEVFIARAMEGAEGTDHLLDLMHAQVRDVIAKAKASP